MLSCADQVLQPGLDDGGGLGDLGPVQLESLLLELELKISPPAALVLVKPDDWAARTDLDTTLRERSRSSELTSLFSCRK